ncbi:peptidylprolyl isomerase [Pontimicrobium sp. IMCC45349]|uniref:peptidylprolyl isomerase n=1 Tax=Pontimicrobium sp. IMCC45349 TaxID=3391574 RepID=UPI0039A1D3A8
MRKNIFLICLALVFSVSSYSQIKKDDVLFTVAGEPVFASEFLRVYNKNLNLVKDESQKDVDEYLKLFINYKLKLAEAKALDYDKKPEYIREFNSYKKQLTKNYLTDSKVTEALVKEAYDRIAYDVKASHVLVRIAEGEKDTIQAYNQILDYRNRLAKDGFDKLKEEIHNGNTIFVEDLGYFSGFKMVYDFETVAYNTEIGEISQPFKTQFGYHVVQVFDKRKSRGEVTVGHIMISNNQKDSTIVPEKRIKEIYKLIEQGDSFEALAKQFSDDKSSANKGGKLSSFKSGQLSSVKFEDKAFEMENIGDISKPFKTDYGWHITKLYGKKPLESFKKLKPSLETKVKRDSRSKLINTAMVNKLKKKYNVIDDKPNLEYFIKALNPSFYSKKWTIPTDLPQDKLLLKIGDKQLTYFHFAEYLKNTQKNSKNRKPFDVIVKEQYEEFVNANVLKYREENLENENEEFAQILKEYREGLLLFDLMQTKIWEGVKSDSVGLENYYQANKSNYKWPLRVDAIVATASKEENIKKVKKLLEKNTTIETINSSLNNGKTQNVIFTTEVMDASHRALPKAFVFEKGVSKIYTDNDAFYVVKVKEILPESIKTLEEAKGRVISDYQTVVENNWLKELENNYKVVVDKKILKKVKSQIYN